MADPLVRARDGRRALVIAADSPLRRFGLRLPWWARSGLPTLLRHGLVRQEALENEHLDFEEIHQRFFRDRTPAALFSKAVSSRHFDAVGTKSCELLLTGRYNDILVWDRHYIALEPDLSNVDAEVARSRDPGERRAIVEEAYEHVMEAHTYAHRMCQVYQAVCRVILRETREALLTVSAERVGADGRPLAQRDGYLGWNGEIR